jgi:protein-S-isoprenylcysteine O-methyltransferase Ste14
MMISLTVTNYLKDRLGSNYRFYRLFYNLIALITLIPVSLYSASLTGQVLFRWDGFGLIFQSILVIAALVLFISGAMKYDMLQLFGIRQIKSGNSHSTLSENGDIDTSGVLSLTRHPWYLAAIIFVWIRYRDMYVSTLVVNMILTVYIVIGTVLEERKLITEYGENYRDYKEKVSMLVPFKWISGKLSLVNK